MAIIDLSTCTDYWFPEWLKTASLALPLTHTTHLLQATWLQGQWNGFSSLVLVGMGAVSAGLAAAVFRWT